MVGGEVFTQEVDAVAVVEAGLLQALVHLGEVEGGEHHLLLAGLALPALAADAGEVLAQPVQALPTVSTASLPRHPAHIAHLRRE